MAGSPIMMRIWMSHSYVCRWFKFSQLSKADRRCTPRKTSTKLVPLQVDMVGFHGRSRHALKRSMFVFMFTLLPYDPLNMIALFPSPNLSFSEGPDVWCWSLLIQTPRMEQVQDLAKDVPCHLESLPPDVTCRRGCLTWPWWPVRPILRNLFFCGKQVIVLPQKMIWFPMTFTVFRGWMAQPLITRTMLATYVVFQKAAPCLFGFFAKPLKPSTSSSNPVFIIIIIITSLIVTVFSSTIVLVIYHCSSSSLASSFSVFLLLFY